MSLYNPSMTIDIKLRFQPTDMTPGPDGRRFQRDLLNLGGKSDNRGYSYADTHVLTPRRGSCQRSGRRPWRRRGRSTRDSRYTRADSGRTGGATHETQGGLHVPRHARRLQGDEEEDYSYLSMFDGDD